MTKEMDMDAQGMRLNKYLSAVGYCSRRDADKLIDEGAVTVDGEPATLGTRVRNGQTVAVNGKDIAGKKERSVLLAVNKPRGIICSTKDDDHGDVHVQNIVDFLHYPIRIYPIGRLDKESDGLILMTNEGDLVNRILRARFMHEKEYVCTVNRPIDETFLRGMRAGVYIPELETTTRPCKVTKTGTRSFRIVLTQGLNRQIRRMCEQLGYHVRALKRIRIMNIRLGDLEKGEYREVAGEELEELMKLLDSRDEASDKEMQMMYADIEKYGDEDASGGLGESGHARRAAREERERFARGERNFGRNDREEEVRRNSGRDGAKVFRSGSSGNVVYRSKNSAFSAKPAEKPAGKRNGGKDVHFSTSHKITITRRTGDEDGRRRKNRGDEENS